MSVITPLVVPTSTTLAPMIDSPLASITTPVIDFFCAMAPREHKMHKIKKMVFFISIAF